VPCARSSWPFHQLLSARKYIVSYRIVSYHSLLHRSFWLAKCCLWNQLLSSAAFKYFYFSLVSSRFSDAFFCWFIAPSSVTASLSLTAKKAKCFTNHSLHVLLPGPFLLSYLDYVFIFSLFFSLCAVRQIKLAISSAVERTLFYRNVSYSASLTFQCATLNILYRTHRHFIQDVVEIHCILLHSCLCGFATELFEFCGRDPTSLHCCCCCCVVSSSSCLTNHHWRVRQTLRLSLAACPLPASIPVSKTSCPVRAAELYCARFIFLIPALYKLFVCLPNFLHYFLPFSFTSLLIDSLGE